MLILESLNVITVVLRHNFCINHGTYMCYVDVLLLKAVQTGGRDIKQCAPGPPMDIIEETPGCSKDAAAGETDEEEGLPQQKFEDSGLIPQIDKPMSMPYLCCKLWRWKELQVYCIV